MTAERSTVTDWVRLIRAEYRESPGLHLTKLQVCRLWGLDHQTCDDVLDALVSTAILKRASGETYALVG